MPELLGCVTEGGTTYPCCAEAPYELQWADCVRQCLIELLRDRTFELNGTLASAVRSGADTATVMMEVIQDHQMLIELIMLVFHERRAAILRTGTDPGNEALWEKHDLSCVSDYFRCKHKTDVRPWFLKAGFYDPAHPPAQSVINTFPGYYDLPCDVLPPSPPVPPDPWPPVPPSCSFQPDYTIQGSVDLGLMFIGLMGPFLQGTNLYLVQSIDVNGTGAVPDGTPGAVNDIISITSDGVSPPVIEVVSSDWSIAENINSISDDLDLSALNAGLYLLIGNEVHAACPEIQVTVIEPGAINIVSVDPVVAALTDPLRFVNVLLTTDGITWSTVTTVPESALVGGIDIFVDPDYLGIRFEYTWENGQCTCPAECPESNEVITDMLRGCPVDCDTEGIFTATIPAGWTAYLQQAVNGQWVTMPIEGDSTDWAGGMAVEGPLADYHRLVAYNMGCNVIMSCPFYYQIETSEIITVPCNTSTLTVEFTVPTVFPPGWEYGGLWIDPGTGSGVFQQLDGEPGDDIVVGPLVGVVNTAQNVTIEIRDLNSDCTIRIYNKSAICI